MDRKFTIGREETCDICLNDPSSVISRYHATIVCRKGKYFLTDSSLNGTYVNGCKIAKGVETRIERSDEVSFAHQVDLDWNLIPKPRLAVWKIGVAVLLVLLLVGGVVWYVRSGSNSRVIVNSDDIEQIITDKKNDKKPVLIPAQDGDKPADAAGENMKEEGVKKDSLNQGKKKATKKSTEKKNVEEKEIINAIY